MRKLLRPRRVRLGLRGICSSVSRSRWGGKYGRPAALKARRKTSRIGSAVVQCRRSSPTGRKVWSIPPSTRVAGKSGSFRPQNNSVVRYSTHSSTIRRTSSPIGKKLVENVLPNLVATSRASWTTQPSVRLRCFSLSDATAPSRAPVRSMKATKARSLRWIAWFAGMVWMTWRTCSSDGAGLSNRVQAIRESRSDRRLDGSCARPRRLGGDHDRPDARAAHESCAGSSIKWTTGSRAKESFILALSSSSCSRR